MYKTTIASETQDKKSQYYYVVHIASNVNQKIIAPHNIQQHTIH